MMKINKIQNTNLNLKVRGQGCADDCTEKKSVGWKTRR